MQYLLLVYIDPELLKEVPAADYDRLMHGCLSHADELQAQDMLLLAQQLQSPSEARSVRVRAGRASVTDGPFAETKEILAGFNLIEAADIEAATRIAHEFPWTRYGCIEVRPVHDMNAERRRVGMVA